MTPFLSVWGDVLEEKTCLKGNWPSIIFQHGQTGDFGCEEGHSELGREESVCLN